MKIAIGLDAIDRLRVAAGLVADCKFSSADVELVHVLERLGEVTAPLPEGTRPDLITNFLKMQEDEANKLLSDGSAAVERLGLPTRRTLLTGFSANKIVAHVAGGKADLLALSCSEKSSLERALLGSVSRKALIGAECSVLIAKNYQRKEHGLTVVLATDHSLHAKRSIAKFLSWRPKGIARAVVLTVYPEQALSAMNAVMSNFKADVASWARKELAKENADVAKELATHGITCTSRVESGAVSETLARVMTEEKADLLVLGAQGRGFVDRVFLGSIALDQALGRPYSVLVVRP